MKLKPLMLIPKSKRGVLGLDIAKAVILAFLTIAVLGVVAIVALVSLKDANILTSGTSEYNQTQNIINNVTSGAASFFSNAGTIFTILGVVVIISAIAIIVVIVNRFGTGARGGGL